MEDWFWGTLWSQYTFEVEKKIYKTIIRPSMFYGSECWTIMKQHVKKVNVAEMRMLRLMDDNTLNERNDCIREN